MKKILVTGASGFVGSRVVAAMKDGFELLTPSHGAFDITSASSVDEYITRHRPEAILHLAAISNTWYCQQHPDESYRVNVLGVENIAAAAARYGVKYVFFSSDQVYNGNCEKGLLSEDIAVAPENHYGCHKLLAEERAMQLCENSVALRATWMYDIPREGMPTHNNFVTSIRSAIEQLAPLAFATREYRGITSVDEVVRNIPHTFALPGGVYNFGAENSLNTYETASAYFDMLQCGIEKEKIVVPDYERFPEHERNLSISIKKATEASGGAIRFSDTLTGLQLFAEQHFL